MQLKKNIVVVKHEDFVFPDMALLPDDMKPIVKSESCCHQACRFLSSHVRLQDQRGSLGVRVQRSQLEESVGLVRSVMPVVQGKAVGRLVKSVAGFCACVFLVHFLLSLNIHQAFSNRVPL